MRTDNVKRRIVEAVLILLICVGLYFIIDSNREKESSFEIPEKTKYIIVYSTGETKNEKSIINYFDSVGNTLGKNQLNQNVNPGSISYSPIIDDYVIFTHEQILFNQNKKATMTNEEMKSTYKFATDNGVDEVYTDGYMKEWNLFYKHIPHGLAYAKANLGHFDLLTFFGEKDIYNVRVKEGGIVTANQTESAVYNFYGDSGKYVYYEVLKFDKEKKEFICNEGKIDLTAFLEDKLLGNKETYIIGKTVVKDNRIYQILELGEKSIPYLVEYKVSNGQIDYENSYKMELKKRDYMGEDIPVIIKENKILYFSELWPNAVITFDLKEKAFQYQRLFEEKSYEELEQIRLQEINGKVYAFKSDIDKMVFEIYQIKEDGTKKRLVEGKLPEVKALFSPDLWMGDFYVMP